MALSIKPQDSEQALVRLSVEMSPEVYERIVQQLAASETAISIDDLMTELGTAFRDTVTGLTAAALTEEVEVELRIVQRRPEEVEDDDPVEEFRQAWHDAMTGNTHPASILWDDDFWNSDDGE